MSIETHENENAPGHGSYERRDIGVAGVLYFFLGLAAVTVVIHFLLAGFYDVLEKRNAEQTPASPLMTNVPADTRHIPNNYPDKAFPDPRLENDERNQLNQVRLSEERTLNSYGWIDEKSKTVRIPIERAMDLVAQRGLPVRPATASAGPSQTAVTKRKGKKP